MLVIPSYFRAKVDYWPVHSRATITICYLHPKSLWSRKESQIHFPAVRSQIQLWCIFIRGASSRLILLVVSFGITLRPKFGLERKMWRNPTIRKTREAPWAVSKHRNINSLMKKYTGTRKKKWFHILVHKHYGNEPASSKNTQPGSRFPSLCMWD